MHETILHFASALEAGFTAVGQPALRVALTSGGDERLAIDPRTGRNRYGIPAGHAPGETCFASSFASPISPRGHAAAEAAFGRLLAGGPRTAADWTDAIRARLLRLYGIPGSTAVLAASATEAEFIVLALARATLARPIVNLVLAPSETGEGVLLAAAGRHVLTSASLGRPVERGVSLDGFAEPKIVAEGIAIRETDGRVRDPAAVDRMVLQRAKAALEADRDLLVHCLDTSKTGLAGFSRATAGALQAHAKGRCLIVVDASQLRCPPETIRQDLAAGFAVMITGSTFAGGPPFAGAVIVPPTLAEALDRLVPPPGLGSYSAVHDWPSPLHDRVEPVLPTMLNIGLGLRWEAALAELEALAGVEPAIAEAIVTRFGELVAHHVAATPGLSSLPSGALASGDRRTIHPIVSHDARGEPLCARTLHRDLMTPGERGYVFHLGRPVEIGASAALSVCLSAPQIVDVAARAASQPLDIAMAPLASDLLGLFVKWSVLREAASDEASRSLRRA